MERRLHMESINRDRFVEMPDTPMGKEFMLGLRRNNPEIFKCQRITSIIQANPDKVKIGIFVYR